MAEDVFCAEACDEVRRGRDPCSVPFLIDVAVVQVGEQTADVELPDASEGPGGQMLATLLYKLLLLALAETESTYLEWKCTRARLASTRKNGCETLRRFCAVARRSPSPDDADGGGRELAVLPTC